SINAMGPEAKRAVPALLRALNNKGLHDEAFAALVAIGKAGVPALVEGLDQEKFMDRIEAIKVLGEIGPDASEAISALSARAKDDPYPRVRKEAVAALRKIQR